MKILVDVNLSPRWIDLLRGGGHDAEHWGRVGDPRAEDAIVMAWARERGAILFTHDLDFGAILASTGGRKPSVIQVRTGDPSPENIGALALRVLAERRADLDTGALLTVHERRARVTILPLRG